MATGTTLGDHTTVRRQRKRIDAAAHAAEGRRWALHDTHTPHVVELSGWGGVTYSVSNRWACVHALLGPLLLTAIGVGLSHYVHEYTFADSFYVRPPTQCDTPRKCVTPRNATRRAIQYAS